MRVVVFASGGGSNFQAMIDRFGEGADGVELVGLVASRPDAGAVGRAETAGIQVHVADGDAGPLIDALDDLAPDLIVLAGYMRLIPEDVVRRWWGRIINIHPALLPAFGGKGMYGARVHRAVVESGARVTGATVHFVDEAYDRGPIIAQWPVPVLQGDGPEEIAARVLRVEHRLLPRVVGAIARGEVTLGAEGRVTWNPDPLEEGSFGGA